MHWFAISVSGSSEDVARFRENAETATQSFAFGRFSPSPVGLDEAQLPIWREKNWGCDEIDPTEVFGPEDPNNDASLLRWDMFVHGGIPWSVIEATSRQHPDLDLVAAAAEPNMALAQARQYRNGSETQSFDMPSERLAELLSQDDSESRYTEDAVIDELLRAISAPPEAQMTR